jgi:hypothetical protein
MYNSILTKEELEALLTMEELEVFIAEQEGQLEHELMLSPAHLLLALRELEETVVRLTSRVEHLENQLDQKPAGFEESLISDEAELEEEFTAEEAVTYIEPLTEGIESSDDSDMERVILLSAHTTSSSQVPSLISRSARHRERKPSILSKLLK